MTAYVNRGLYGGAITADLPQGYVDGSDLRQIPSHQELFLSPATLTSVIIEINSQIPQPLEAAIATHFHDPVDPPDTSNVTASGQVSMVMPSLSSCSAYLASGEITSYESVHAARGQSNGQAHTVAFVIKSFILVVRIAFKETDLCIRINVPLKELDEAGSAREEGFAQAIMDRIVATLEVKDFGLFVD